ncbi:MAG: PaaI family thioesterase [Caulobacteraceae bacterium]|nr:PaaI family thioesterase [Caulobacteraceae bacterium]
MSDDLTPSQAAVVPEGYEINLWQRGFGRTVGPFYSKRHPDGREVMGFRVEEHHANGMGNCHGGMLSSFADMAWGRVISSNRSVGWVTVRLTTDFLSGAHMGDWVEGSSDIISEVDDIYTVRGRIWCGDRLLMTGTGVYKGVVRRQPHFGGRKLQGDIPETA